MDVRNYLLRKKKNVSYNNMVSVLDVNWSLVLECYPQLGVIAKDRQHETRGTVIQGYKVCMQNCLITTRNPVTGQCRYRAPATPEGSRGTRKEGVMRGSQDSVKYIKRELPSVNSSTDRENWGYLWRKNIVATHMTPISRGKIRKKEIQRSPSKTQLI